MVYLRQTFVCTAKANYQAISIHELRQVAPQVFDVNRLVQDRKTTGLDFANLLLACFASQDQRGYSASCTRS
jgi:hypothetical protein